MRDKGELAIKDDTKKFRLWVEGYLLSVDGDYWFVVRLFGVSGKEGNLALGGVQTEFSF